jgi:ATP-dependent protease ClpP protease subunit
MEGHITIYGEIVPYQDDNSGSYGAVNLKSVMEEINSQSKADEFVMHIHSIGGDVDEAFAIFDALKASGKKLTASIEGMCASSATIIALAAADRKMTENSQFMIHLPMGWKEGTAEEMQDAADTLKEYEEKVLNLYVSETGGDRAAIAAMMKNETFLTSEQAQTLGFITEMVATMKAVARINLKNNTMTQMTAKELDTKMDGWFDKIMKAFKTKPVVKMITVTTADGTILDFGDAIEEESQIAVGTTATVDGAAANGEFVLTDGRTLVFAEGAVTEIREAAAEETVEALKAKLAEAEKKIADMEVAKAESDKEVVTMKAAMKTFKKEYKKFKTTMFSDMGLKPLDGKESKETKDGDPKVRHLWKETA